MMKQREERRKDFVSLCALLIGDGEDKSNCLLTGWVEKEGKTISLLFSLQLHASYSADSSARCVRRVCKCAMPCVI